MATTTFKYNVRDKTGKVISGIDSAQEIAGVTVYHAGTALHEGRLVTNGGRLLGVTATGSSPPSPTRTTSRTRSARASGSIPRPSRR